MRDDQGGHAGLLEETVPQQALRLHVERAGEVVEHKQLRPARQHPRGGGPLRLPAGEPRAARPDDRLETPLQRGDVAFQRRPAHRHGQGGFARRQAEQDVVAQRLAEEARDLGRIGDARRHAPGRRIGDAPPVPADLARLRRQLAEQGAQKGRLARPDPPGDRHDLAGSEAQIDLLDAAPRAGVAVGQPDRLEADEAIALAPRRRFYARQWAGQVERPRRHQRLGPRAAQQPDQPPERDPRPLVGGQRAAEEPRELAHRAEVVDEEGEVADRERAGAQRPGGEEQDQPGPQAGAVGENRAQGARQHGVAERQPAPLLVEAAEVRDQVRLRPGKLHRLHRLEPLAERAGHAVRRPAALLPVAFDPREPPPRDRHHRHRRQDDEQGEPRVDPQEQRQRPGREEDRADAVAEQPDQPRRLRRVVAEVAQRLARRRAGPPPLRPGEDRVEQVAAHDRADHELVQDRGEDGVRLQHRPRQGGRQQEGD